MKKKQLFLDYIKEQSTVKKKKGKVNVITITPLLDKYIDDFIQSIPFEIGEKFGFIFEKFVAYILSDRNKKACDYIVQHESNNEGAANFGVDIIYPNKKANEIVFMQCKAYSPVEKKAHFVGTLEQRQKDFIDDMQNEDFDINTLQRKWKIPLSTINTIKKHNKKWTFKIVWLEFADKFKTEKLNNSKALRWGISELFASINKMPSPFLVKATNNYTFNITSKFSNSREKYISKISEKSKKKDNKQEVESLVVPVQVGELIDFLKSVDDVSHLFTMNVRDYQGKGPIPTSMITSIKSKPEDFFIMNNGITIIAKKITVFQEARDLEYKVKGIRIINGQQTALTLLNHANELEQKSMLTGFILLKIVKSNKEAWIRKIAASTNTQKLIKPEEIYSTFAIHKDIHNELIKHGIFYKFRSGTTEYEEQFSFWPKVKIDQILKYWAAREGKDVWIKNKKSQLMNIFVDPNGKIGTNFKLIAEKFNETKNSVLVKDIAQLAIRLIDSEKYKKNINISQSFDMYQYFYILNPSVAISDEFINTFNNEADSAKDHEVTINTGNVANVFKSKTNSQDIFDNIETKFDEMVKKLEA